jgi:hypothetical protein
MLWAALGLMYPFSREIQNTNVVSGDSGGLLFLQLRVLAAWAGTTKPDAADAFVEEVSDSQDRIRSLWSCLALSGRTPVLQRVGSAHRRIKCLPYCGYR